MKLSRYIYTILIYLLPVLVFSQPHNPDSLKNLLSNSRTDSARFSLSTALSMYFQEVDRDSALYYSDQAALIAQRNNHTLDEANALDTRGYILMHLQDYPASFQSFQDALKIAEDPKSEGKTWNKSDQILNYKTRLFVLANIHHDLGHLMGYAGDVEKQIFHYKETQRLAIESGEIELSGYGKFSLIGLVNMNLGFVNMKLNRLDSALILLKTADSIFEESDYRQYQAMVNLRIGSIYSMKGDEQVALKYYYQAVRIGNEQNNLRAVGLGYSALTDHFLGKGQQDSSLYYAEKTLKVFEAIKSQFLGVAYKYLSESYKLQGNIDSAFKYQGLAMIADDSLYQSTITNLSDFQKLSFKEQLRLQELEKEKIQTLSKARIYGLIAGLSVFILVAVILFRNNRQKQKANKVLNTALTNLKETQTQLIHSEKMASLGELTAGIAHEIQNPLNFVNNFSEVSVDMVSELNEEMEDGNTEEVKAIADDLKQNLEKIHHHGERASFIVKGMLEHSRASTGEKVPVDINALADEYLRLAYHGLRAKDKSFNASYETDLDDKIPMIDVIPQDIGRVLLNLINNGFHTVAEKAKIDGDGYRPGVVVSTKMDMDQVVIRVKDNGNGIPDKVKEKIFQPFFTTKPTGEGTGLGLSLSFDIITKGHNGQLEVETKEGAGSEFIIRLPLN